MSETSVIKEFLVALGFRTDEAALKNFQSGIDKASKAVFGLAAAIETTAVGVAAGVARWASGLEALYFASIRTGSSAASLKAFDRAAQDFGASAGEALGSVEGLAHAFAREPFRNGRVVKDHGGPDSRRQRTPARDARPADAGRTIGSHVCPPTWDCSAPRRWGCRSRPISP